MHVIKFNQLKETPWRNGGGVTRDIARAEVDGTLLWRLSIADVARDGPFSDFAGLTRVLTVIEGGPMVLRLPSGAVIARRCAPVTFDGGLPVSAELPEGPLRDLNLMYDPGRVQAEVQALHGPFEGQVAPGPATPLRAVFGVSGGGHLGGVPFAVGDMVLLQDEAARLRLSGGASVLLFGLGQGASWVA